MSARNEAARLEQDGAAWDEFVAASPQATYLQSSAWAEIKRANGWQAVRVATRLPAVWSGAQFWFVGPRGLPWDLGYVPRGPIGARLDRPALARLH